MNRVFNAMHRRFFVEIRDAINMTIKGEARMEVERYMPNATRTEDLDILIHDELKEEIEKRK